MEHRLAPLHLLPPPADTPWTGAFVDLERGSISRRHGESITVGLPLFWYDPPWYQVTLSQADNISVAVGELGVLVSALRSDLSGPGSESVFHSGREVPSDESDKPELRRYSRMVPYRPERYGFVVKDFDACNIIDLRLTMPRDVTGRFAYSPAQIQRWESAPSTAPVAGGGWVPAATFPPDVESIDHLGSKVRQLRRLADSAAIFLSIGPFRTGAELPKLLAAEPDGVILRLDEIQLDGLELATLTHRMRVMMDQQHCESLPLWVVPGAITPDDAVKLVALGASAIAIDSWCNPLIDLTRESQSGSSRDPRPGNVKHEYDPRWGDFARDNLEDLTERFLGLFEALHSIEPGERLGSFNSSWAKALGIHGLR